MIGPISETRSFLTAVRVDDGEFDIEPVGLAGMIALGNFKSTALRCIIVFAGPKDVTVSNIFKLFGTLSCRFPIAATTSLSSISERSSLVASEATKPTLSVACILLKLECVVQNGLAVFEGV